MSDLLNTHQLAAAIGFSSRAIERGCRRGTIPHTREITGNYRFDLPVVLAAINKLRHERVALPEAIERVYVAGPSLELPRARRLIREVTELGIAVTYDWPIVVDAGGSDAELSPSCLEGILRAQVAVVLAPTGVLP